MTRKFLALVLINVLACVMVFPGVRAEDEVPLLQPIRITELLPNPASPIPDDEGEYVELHNPNTVPVNLGVYTLHTGSQSNTYEFALTGVVLQPGEYRAFYSAQTHLTLVNSNTGQAWLVGPGFVRVSETPWYPANMGDNKAWALINGSWEVTSTLTPGAANPLPPAPVPPTPEQTPATTNQLEPCPEGKVRNPETNRCKTIEQPTMLAPCAAGQERNPATNRCRSVSAETNPLTPCDVGEERNPETNRCRKVTIKTELAACQEGYERNPDTNRCRKVTAVKASTTNKPGGPAKNPGLNYTLLGGVSVLIMAYGIYEYRQDIATVYGRLKNHIKRSKK